MQDGAGCHISQWNLPTFAHFSVDLLDWPGNSPDLNPIEHIWNLIKNRVSQQRPFIKGREMLEAAWYKEWENLSIEKDINPLIENMHRRCNQVIDHSGGNNFHG